MSDAIYHQEILKLAKAWRDDAQLENDGVVSIRHDNPLCGDTVAIAAAREQGTITALSLQVRGCVLCKAAAHTLTKQTSNDNRLDSLNDLCQQASDMFASNEVPSALSIFTPVTDYPARHECVLLPYAALAKIILILQSDHT